MVRPDMRADEQPDTVDFGYRDVPPEQKTRLVRDVFDGVAGHYDLMNDLMSLGIHRLWKAALVDLIAPRDGIRLLDVAGGTGDIASAVLHRVARAGGRGTALLCDITEAMVRAGRDREIDAGLRSASPDDGGSRLLRVVGDAAALPVADRSVDVYVIAFGLRNVTDKPAALAEARRVLRPGGRFFCLEFSRVERPALARLYDLYSFRVLPRLGAAVTGRRDAYAYLVESIRRFPDRAALAALLEAAGLDRVRIRPLSGGIATIHAAWRL